MTQYCATTTAMPTWHRQTQAQATMRWHASCALPACCLLKGPARLTVPTALPGGSVALVTAVPARATESAEHAQMRHANLEAAAQGLPGHLAVRAHKEHNVAVANPLQCRAPAIIHRSPSLQERSASKKFCRSTAEVIPSLTCLVEACMFMSLQPVSRSGGQLTDTNSLTSNYTYFQGNGPDDPSSLTRQLRT